MVKKAAQATPNQLLRQARLERGWTQKDVADKIGSPVDINVTRWERGTARPSGHYIQRLCELFGKNPAELGLLPAQSQETIYKSIPVPEVVSASVEPDPLWNVPFNRNPFFTGRVELLDTLHKLLNRDQRTTLNQPYALTGLGGIGKTQAAVEYAYHYRDEYHAIFWVRAADRETLVADFVSLASLLALPIQNTTDQMAIVATVNHWLMYNARWLLILDNADEFALLPDFLPRGGQGHVLLTTRAQATGKIAESLSIEKMEVSEGMHLLLRRARRLALDAPLDNVQRKLRDEAQTIVAELDGLPLALDQAGAYLEETGCSFAEYLALYRHRQSTLLQRQSSIMVDYPYTVASTWSLSFSQVEQANPAAAELLQLCAFLHPDVIPEVMLAEGATELGPVLGPMVVDQFAFNEAIQVLRRYSLVKRDPETKLLNIHRLVQIVLKESLDEATQRRWAERTIRAVNAAFPEVNFDTWNHCKRYLPHVQACASLIEQFDFTFQEAARLLNDAGCYLCSRGLYRQAEPLLQRALAIRELTLGANHLATAQTLHELAFVYSYQAQYEQAEAFLLRALTIREQVQGAEHPETASTLNQLANLHIDQGMLGQAEPLLQRALAIRELKLGSEHPAVAESLNDLGSLSVYQGKYGQAELFYTRAISTREHILEANHPDIAVSLNGLAWIYNYQEKYEQAEPLYLRALAIFEQALELNHPYIAVNLNNLAGLYRKQGNYEQAKQRCQQALAIQEQMLAPNNLYLAATLNNLAAIYQVQGQYEQAGPLYLRAFAIQEQVLGSEHPDTVITHKRYTELQSKIQGVPDVAPEHGAEALS